ncbi:MAG: transcriptional repressor LexA [Actinobacteria bacterium]|nr:transcriptional repressor LexA [Actinomycetota bacterium]MBU1944754.1 transcriptional repressor LexA [Actinomycetota bacterium]MBU2688845.1 transcriptional repressor LexA [Actinomycetota bacterium]
MEETRLTKRQMETLEFLGSFRRENGYSPTVREVAGRLGVSSSATVAEHLDSLEAGGLIVRRRDHARSVLLTDRASRLLSSRGGAGGRGGTLIPLMGTIAAGEPIEAVAVPEQIEVTATLAGGRVYALKVRGSSMIDEGIFDGDYVVVEENPSPENGETVVALIDGERATLKKLYRERAAGGGRIRLQPANPEMEPIVPGPDERVEIQGRVRAVLRIL